ncbi:MAG: hypothetical protein WAO55_11885 [Candidatus Manganitrophaceae bacterium]
MEVYRLYQEKKSLRAVGREVGLSCERVRQLMEKGAVIGLFEYRPEKPPVLSREKILKDYQKFLSLSRVAKKSGISTNYLTKLIAQHQITKEDLSAAWREGRRTECIDQYLAIASKLGHHPTTSELHRSKSTRSLAFKIRRLWGSLEAFREESAFIPGTLIGREIPQKKLDTTQPSA